MNRSLFCLAAVAALFLAGCAGDDLTPERETSAAIHSAPGPNPSRHVPQRPMHDQDGWPVGR